MKRLLPVMVSVLFAELIYSQQLPEKQEVISTLKLVNDYWIQNHPDPGNNEWARAAYFTGNMELYKTYPKRNYKNYADLWAENNNWSLNGGSHTRNADNQCAGQTYIDLYWLDTIKQDYKIAEIDSSITTMLSWNKIDDWWWIDALYMAMPVFARLGAEHNDTTFFNRMYAMYRDTKIRRNLYNSTSGLWYRDESFAPPYTTPNGFDSYWSRGNGWVFGAHVRILELLPDTNINRTEYIETFQKMAQALKVRQRDDGFWNVSLDDPDDYGGPETSGTSFFTYGIAWGINNGYLDSTTYYPVVAAAWEGLTQTAVHEDGYLGFVQGVGSNPSSSQPVTYETTTDFGVGAFLLAGSEVVKLAPGKMPEPPVFFMDSVIVINRNTIQVFFNDTVDEASGIIISNYSIPDVIILNAKPGIEKTSTILSISDLTVGEHQLTIENISSKAGKFVENGEYIRFIYSGAASVTASSYEEGTDNRPERTVDFDFNTRWSAEGLGEWILYDLGKTETVSSVDIAFYMGNARQAYFSISLSVNGIDFTEVYNGESGGTTVDLENFDFPDQNARFVKITGYGNSFNLWNSYTEVRINIIPGDATLSELSIDSGSLDPEFNRYTTHYKAFVPKGTTSVTVTAIANDTVAAVSGTGVIDITSGIASANILVIARNESDSMTYIVEIVVDTTSNQINNGAVTKLISVYPNPFKDKFYIDLEGKYTCIMYDSNGNQLLEEIKQNNGTIYLPGKSGVYYLKIISNNQTKTIKLIKL